MQIYNEAKIFAFQDKLTKDFNFVLIYLTCYRKICLNVIAQSLNKLSLISQEYYKI